MHDHLIRRIKAGVPDDAAFLELGIGLADAGNLASLNETLIYRNARGGSGSALAFEIASHLLAAGRLDVVHGLCRGFGDSNPFSAPLHCAGAFAHFLRFEHDQGLALLREGVRRLSLLVEQHPRETLPPAYLTKLVAASFLFEPLDQLPRATGDPGPLTVLYPGDWTGRAALCAAFGDSLYFQTYGDRLDGSFFAHGGDETALLIGIVDPDTAALERAAELVRHHPGLTIARVGYGGKRLAEYCCSVRFLFAETLLGMAGRPLNAINARRPFDLIA